MSGKGIFRPCLPRGVPRRAFTLIELLVVISIVALLMAVLLPTLNRVRREGRAVVCQAKLRQWGQAFSGEWGVDSDAPESNRWLYTAGAWWINRATADSPNVDGLLLCPMAAKKPSDESPFASSPNPPKVRDPPILGDVRTPWCKYTDREPPELWGSYGISGPGADAAHYTYVRPSAIRVKRSYALSRIPILLDCVGFLAVPSPGNDPPEYEGQVDPFSNMKYVCINRHDGGINALFLDWSVRKVGLKELWTLKWWALFDTAGCWTKAGGVQPEDWPAWMRGFKDY